MPEHPLFDAVERDILHPARIAADDLGDWFRNPFARHRAAAPQAPDASPASITPTTEVPMSLSDDLKAFAARLENLGEETVTKAEQIGTEGVTKAQAILASPAAAEGFTLLHTLTGVNIDPAIVTQALGGLRAIVQAYAPVNTAASAQAPEAPAEAPASA